MPESNKNGGNAPRALLIQPPVYDFALYDLFLKPVGLLGVGYQLSLSGYEVSFVNALDYSDSMSLNILGKPPRKPDGTGKFFREIVEPPEVLRSAGRTFARYGMHRDAFKARIFDAFDGEPPDLVLLGTGMTYWYPGVQETVRLVRRMYPGTPIVAGGVYATLLSEHCLGVCGPDAVVPGPVYPGINPFLSGLGLPELAEPEGGYRVLMEGDAWTDAGVLLLNRGCPYSCAYCASRLVSGPFTPGNPDTLFAAAEGMFLSFGTRNFAFYDDALLVRKEDVLFPFLSRVSKAGYPFSFYVPNAVHISLIDEETALRLYSSGFQEIRLGFESSSIEFHEQMDGKITKGALDEALRSLGRAGFGPGQVTVYILSGLPEQEAAEVEKSVEFVASRGVRISLSEYSPVPGSTLWEKSVNRANIDIAGEPLLQNNTFFPMEWEKFTREDLRRLKEGVRKHNSRVMA